MSDESSGDTAYDADDTSPAESFDNPDGPESDNAPAEGSGGRGRPPIAVIISAVLLFAAIGVGLAFMLPAPPTTPAAQSSPIAGTTTTETNPASVPTALPLLAATGEYSSTEVIAQVGSGTVTRGEFVRSFQAGAEPTKLLNQLIQVELVMQEAVTEGVTTDDAAVEKQLVDLRQSQANGDAAQFAAFLEHAKVGSEENLRRLIRRDLVIEQMILRHTSAEQAHARHILLSTTVTTDTAKLDQIKAEAEALLKELEGGADFAALAAKRSDDPGSKEAGGDLGWAPRGLFVGPFDEAVFSMKVGERRLIQTQFGWHIIELLDAPKVQPFATASMLQTPAGQEAFTATFMPWIEGLQKQAEAAQKIKIVIPAEQLVAPVPGTPPPA